VKRLISSRWLSAILAISFCVGSSPPAAYAQERQAPNTPEVQRAEPRRDADKPARASETAKPEPLSEEESAKLAERSQEPGPEVAGGALSNLHLTYIVIALAAAVLVLILK